MLKTMQPLPRCILPVRSWTAISSSRQAVHKTLARMEEAGLIKCGLVKTVEGRQSLWGITEHGQGMAFDPRQNEIPATKVF